MHRIYSVIATGILLGGLLSAAGAAERSLPSYDERRQAFEQERARDPDAPKPTAAERKIMEDATREVARQLPDPGLKVGDKAPDFTLPNALGKPVRLYDRLEQGPVVLTFYRGAWCPYCNLELHALHDSLPRFHRYGAELIAVTPQKPDKSLEQVKKDGYPFEILSDLDSSVMKAYGLYFEVPQPLSRLYKSKFGLDLADYNGDGRYVLPVPGTFVIDRKGIVRAAYANVDYRQRMEPADIVAALKTLQ